MIRDIRFEPAKKERLVLRNCIKMLFNRNLIETQELNSVSENAVSDYDDVSHTCTVQLSTGVARIKIVNEKISTVSKINGLAQFLETKQEDRRIIICDDIILRAFKEIVEYPLTEVFWIQEFIIDPINHFLTPKHVPLSLAEKEEFLKEYNIKVRDIPRIEKTDPIVRYYNLQVGDIVKIIRSSIASGESVSYRVVTNCSWDKLFQ